MAIFIIRNDGPQPSGLEIKLRRQTPALVAPHDRASVDWFCVGDLDAARSAGHEVVALHDGWYADDTGGGVTIFGPYWEIRDTPFTVREVAPDPAATRPQVNNPTEIVNIRKAIFGA